MIICVNNELEDSTITVNSGDALFPASNLYSPTLYGKEGVCKYVDNIVIDLGSAKQITTIGILRSSQEITVQANSSDSWGAPAYSIVMDEALKVIDKTYRYWRIKTSETGSQYIGQFYLGQPINASYASAGSIPQIQTQDIETTSATGRYFASKGIEKFIQTFTVQVATETEYTEWYNFWVSDNRKKPVIFSQYEETQGGIYPVYFARLNFSPSNRQRFSYVFNFDLMEVT